uniref:Uncharacterized protein n=1 Tax=Chromera velia CCMP2878 TaxID=1169474 RepID=A0A0G4HP10_9ALVE|eukprot:Cvel_29679.t1-p1 / transcript=Cvel_29679.t1 / gene=Cvel_29679 / organism=Chromera_velia_CCMP2878 / gene_product=hypothetical protein / transcript_product=hypothetical protein / location=Cvel_scaffold4106:664-2615(-) / protein_length=428 / sequence_SO=supercontig / SO=protein_coding / is_pseudo=false
MRVQDGLDVQAVSTSVKILLNVRFCREGLHVPQHLSFRRAFIYRMMDELVDCSATSSPDPTHTSSSSSSSSSSVTLLPPEGDTFSLHSLSELKFEFNKPGLGVELEKESERIQIEDPSVPAPPPPPPSSSRRSDRGDGAVDPEERTPKRTLLLRIEGAKQSLQRYAAKNPPEVPPEVYVLQLNAIFRNKAFPWQLRSRRDVEAEIRALTDRVMSLLREENLFTFLHEEEGETDLQHTPPPAETANGNEDMDAGGMGEKQNQTATAAAAGAAAAAAAPSVSIPPAQGAPTGGASVRGYRRLYEVRWEGCRDENNRLRQEKAKSASQQLSALSQTGREILHPLVIVRPLVFREPMPVSTEGGGGDGGPDGGGGDGGGKRDRGSGGKGGRGWRLGSWRRERKERRWGWGTGRRWRQRGEEEDVRGAARGWR